MNADSELLNTIVAHFSLEELNLVLYDMGTDPENVPGRTLSDRARESVLHFKRHTRTPDFAKALAKRKPSVDFSYWGGPLPVEDLHGVLRQLLTAAFNVSEINTLAFDVFPSLYGESGSKVRMTELIIETAINNNMVIPLMEYVRKNNRHQYASYFARVDRALQAHQNKEPELAPPTVQIVQKPAPKANGVNDAIILAAKMYARGHQDGGKVMQDALTLAGIEW